MKTMKRMMVLAGVGLWLLVGCATPPEPFHYQPDNELKPGPGLFTGKEGAYTIYGRPPEVPDETDPFGEDALTEEPQEASDDPAAQ
jgi:hypothetical protein